MPITIRRPGGATKAFVAPPAVIPEGKPVNRLPPSARARIPEPPAEAPAPLPILEAAKALSPVGVEADAAAVRRWKDFPAPNAKAQACAHCGQHYLRPCDDAAKVTCSNYAYARKFGMKEPA